MLRTVKLIALRNADKYWCERGDSNPHGLLRQILSLVRLPIPPLSHVDNKQPKVLNHIA
jgi:hypothetical protein